MMFRNLCLKLWVGTFFVGFSLFFGETGVFAIQVGGIDPRVGSWVAEGMISFDRRDMEWTTDKNNKFDYDRDLYLLTARYGISEWITGYARIGAASLEFEDEPYSNPGGIAIQGDYNLLVPHTNSFTVDLGSEFAWGVGLQGVFWRQDPWRIIGDIQYFSSNDQDGDFSVGGVSYRVNADLDEFQVSLLAGYTYLQAMLYGGITFNDWKSDVSVVRTGGGTATDADVEGDENFGGIIGGDFYFERGWKLNIEGRFGAENAVSASMGYTFY